MNRRELLKNASWLLGIAAIAPFIPIIKNDETEFENESDYHEMMTNDLDERVTTKYTLDDYWVAMQRNYWNCKCEIGWDIAENAKNKTEWIYFNGDRFFKTDQSFVDIISK